MSGYGPQRVTTTGSGADTRPVTVTAPPPDADGVAAERAARIADRELRLAHDGGGRRLVEAVRRAGFKP